MSSRFNSLIALSLIGLQATPVQAQSVVGINDYPARALREGRQGTVTFRLLIDEHGLPEACNIVESSGTPELDNKTCELMMQRARFKPAIKDGKPVKGNYTSRLRWTIPTQPSNASVSAG